MIGRRTFLSKVVRISAGYPFRGAIRGASGAPAVCAVQMKNVSPVAGIDWAGCVRTNLPGKRPDEWLRSGDLLFVARGNQYYSVCVDAVADGLEAVAAPQFFVLRLQSDALDPVFLSFILNHGGCQRYFRRESEGTLTQSIRRSALENTPIVIPPRERQASIVGLAQAAHAELLAAERLAQNTQMLLNGIADELMR